MVSWHHRLKGHESEQTLGGSEGQGTLAYCSSWVCKESDMTERLNKTADNSAFLVAHISKGTDSSPEMPGGH